MTTNTDASHELLALAERCEKATGPDRALDYDIAHIVTRAHMATGLAPAYTGSIDAAMTLVPEGWLLSELYERNAVGEANWRWRATLWQSAAVRPIGQDAPTVSGIARKAHGAKCAPALALCAAALRSQDAHTGEKL